MAINTDYLRALALLETRDGQKSIKGPQGEDSNNLFNIKAPAGQGYTAFDKAEGSRDGYRVYPDREASIQDAVGLMQRRYPQAYEALSNGGSPEQFAAGLKGWATDPAHGQKIVQLIGQVQGKRDLQAAVVDGQGAQGRDQQRPAVVRPQSHQRPVQERAGLRRSDSAVHQGRADQVDSGRGQPADQEHPTR